MKNANTAPQLRAIFMYGICAWIQDARPPEMWYVPQSSISDLLSTAIEEPNSIGWDQLFRGWISISWGAAQQK